MTHHELLEYVRQAKLRGAIDHDIAVQLRTAGWYTIDVQDALELHAKLTAAGMPGMEERLVPVPQSVLNRAVPKHYAPKIVAVAALTFAVAFVLYILFFS